MLRVTRAQDFAEVTVAGLTPLVGTVRGEALLTLVCAADEWARRLESAQATLTLLPLLVRAADFGAPHLVFRLPFHGLTVGCIPHSKPGQLAS